MWSYLSSVALRSVNKSRYPIRDVRQRPLRVRDEPTEDRNDIPRSPRPSGKQLGPNIRRSGARGWELIPGRCICNRGGSGRGRGRLLLIAIGAAVFVAKPVTVETIASIRRRRVVSINDCLAPLLPVAIDSTSRSRPVDNDPRSGAASGRFSERNPAARGRSLSLEPRSQSTDSGH